MVNSEKIKNHYLALLQVVEAEATTNMASHDFLTYLNKYKDQFTSANNTMHSAELKESIRGVNRFADQFVFSAPHDFKIRMLINTLYETLSQS